MQKKILPFILILVTVFLSAYLVFGTYITSVFEDKREAAQVNYAYSISERGDIYFASNEQGVTRVVGLDSGGNQIFSRAIPAFSNASAETVDKIYVTAERSIFVSVLSKRNDRIIGASVYILREDGGYLAKVFSRDTDLPLQRKNLVISSFSEDTENVYFGFRNDDTLEYFTQHKFNYEEAEKTAYYDEEGTIYSFIALPDELFWVSRGKEVESIGRGGITPLFSLSEGAVDDFWMGTEGKIYFSDSIDQSLRFVTFDNLTPVDYVTSNAEISTGVSLKQANGVSLNSLGSMVMVYRMNGAIQLYTGGLAYMTKISGNVPADFNFGLLVVVAIGFGAIIVTFLIFLLYDRVFRRRVANIYRQTLATILMVVVGLTFVTGAIVGPFVTDAITNQYEEKTDETARLIISSLDNGLSPEQAIEMVLNAGALENTGANVRVEMLSAANDMYTVYESGNGYYKGTSIEKLYGADVLKKAMQDTRIDGYASFTIKEPDSERMYSLLPMGENAEIFLVASVDIAEIALSVNRITSAVNYALLAIGLLLASGLLTLQFKQYSNIRKLAKSMEKILAGEAVEDVLISSGDEIEMLSEVIGNFSGMLRLQAPEITVPMLETDIVDEELQYQEFQAEELHDEEFQVESYSRYKGKKSESVEDSDTDLFEKSEEELEKEEESFEEFFWGTPEKVTEESADKEEVLTNEE